MLYKTRGIVLKTTDYSENSVIVQIFTEKFGLQSYLINGIKKSKGKIRMNMLQPLHLTDMVVYHKPSSNIQRISELRNSPVFESIPYNILKSSLALFLNEVLYRSIKNHSNDERLFEFIYSAVELLDRTEEGIANFHLWFLLHLTRYLGFFPNTTLAGADFFDLRDGCYVRTLPLHPQIIQGELIKYFTGLVSGNAYSIGQIKVSGSQRKELLLKLLEYYQLHIDNFGEVKSHQILEEVLH